MEFILILKTKLFFYYNNYLIKIYMIKDNDKNNYQKVLF